VIFFVFLRDDSLLWLFIHSILIKWFISCSRWCYSDDISYLIIVWSWYYWKLLLWFSYYLCDSVVDDDKLLMSIHCLYYTIIFRYCSLLMSICSFIDIGYIDSVIHVVLTLWCCCVDCSVPCLIPLPLRTIIFIFCTTVYFPVLLMFINLCLCCLTAWWWPFDDIILLFYDIGNTITIWSRIHFLTLPTFCSLMTLMSICYFLYLH